MKRLSRPRNSPLEDRAAGILHSIVHAYIDSGEPVASRTISRTKSANLSPASIRNIMADLSEAGYLSQPHTSAGRVPTVRAFHEYVRTIQVSRGPNAEATRLRQLIQSQDSIEARVEQCSHVLMQVSRNMGIAAAIPSANQVLQQVELISLTERRVLMIVVTGDRMVREKVVAVETDISQPELESLRNYVNAEFSGWTFAALQKELKARLEQERGIYDNLMKKLALLVHKGLLDVGLTPSLHTEGAANLLGVDLHLTRERLQALLEALEGKKRILELLDRFLQSSGEIGVRVGLGEVHPSMNQLSLIGVAVSLPGGAAAKVAVLGPMRMNYERVMSAVYHVGQALQDSTT